MLPMLGALEGAFLQGQVYDAVKKTYPLLHAATSEASMRLIFPLFFPCISLNLDPCKDLARLGFPEVELEDLNPTKGSTNAPKYGVFFTDSSKKIMVCIMSTKD